MRSACTSAHDATTKLPRDLTRPSPKMEQGPKPTPFQLRCAEAEKRAKELGCKCPLTFQCAAETARAAGPEHFEQLLCEWIREGELDTAIDYMGRSDAILVNNDPAGRGRALLYALSNGKFKAAWLLLEELHADGGAKDAFDRTTIIRAVLARAGVAMIRALLAAGADPHAADKINRFTALHYLAMCSDDAHMARVLLEAGASHDARDDRGWTPLVVAAYSGHTAVMKALLAAGADPLAAGRDGVTARSAPSEFTAVHWILRAATLRRRLGKAGRLLREFPLFCRGAPPPAATAAADH